MACKKIQRQLNAWMDQALSPEETRETDDHLALCPACRVMAGHWTSLGQALDRLPAMTAPAGFSQRVCQRLFNPEVPDLAQWWRHLTLAWRSAVCGAVLAGLISGAVLGTSLAAPQDTDNLSTSYQSLYEIRRFYP